MIWCRRYPTSLHISYYEKKQHRNKQKKEGKFSFSFSSFLAPLISLFSSQLLYCIPSFSFFFTPTSFFCRLLVGLLFMFFFFCFYYFSFLEVWVMNSSSSFPDRHVVLFVCREHPYICIDTDINTRTKKDRFSATILPYVGMSESSSSSF